MQRARSWWRGDALAVYAHVAQNAGSELAGNPFADAEDLAKHLMDKLLDHDEHGDAAERLHLKHATRGENRVECGTGGKRREDAQGEAARGAVFSFEIDKFAFVDKEHAQHACHKTALQSAAVVEVVGHHVTEQAQDRSGLGAGGENGAKSGHEAAKNTVVAAEVRQRLDALQSRIDQIRVF